MNASAARSIPTINGYEAQFRPVWSARFRTVEVNGQPVYFKTPEAAELAAYRALYAVEQTVMRRDGEIVFAAKSEAERVFQKKGSACIRNLTHEGP